MAEKLTLQQLEAVNNRGGKLLVSAAAGSGKTKVLVDRLLGYLTDPVKPANLDDFLIITYTKAAAAELRGKIAAKLTERIALEPENRHLQQQLQRLYLTKISTVHSFCADILREYAYLLDLSADFRVADETECFALQAKALEQLLDDAYDNAENDPDFCAFIDSQGFGRDDRQIPEILLKVYHSAKCHLDPEAWLDWCVCVGSDQSVTDASGTVWGRYLVEDLHAYLDLQIVAIERCVKLASSVDYMEKPAAILAETVNQLSVLRSCNTWDAIRSHMDIDYGTLRFSAKCTDVDAINQIKAVRDACKKGVAKKLRRFSDDSAQIVADTKTAMCAVRGLVALTKRFDQTYSRMKRSRRILDFNDLEHRMLDLLLGKCRSCATLIAVEIGERFREVMVDEYQDSNEVQDAIFSALTAKRNNCFMVGDVKQSIYQFRLADPGIFLHKYNTYANAGDAVDPEGRKILLSSNFRSCGAVIDAVNDVFSACMSPRVGGLVYGPEEALKEGIPHCALDEPEIELYGIDVCEDTYLEEASFVAQRIRELLDGTHMVRSGEQLRPIVPDDIVILLRSPGSVGGEFQFALEQLGIRCNTGGSADLMQTEEIEVLYALLQVINNPLQDIPLIAVLSSRIFGFTADDLAALRGNCKQGSIYDAVLASNLEKAKAFLQVLTQLRGEAQIHNLSRLLQKVLSLTRMDSVYASLPNGVSCVENLQSFLQMAAGYEAATNGGLTQFLDHLAVLTEKGLITAGEQGTSGAVTIMSIHKSKGLEFPVVFLCGLSRAFNREDTRAQVLCDKQLGLGLACVDTANRVRYPSVAKRAIAAKMTAESLSEEMRVLYVAMTRAKDRLIMTYAAPNVQQELSDISLRMPQSDPLLLTAEADCPGTWVLLTALKNRDRWSVQIVQADSGDRTTQNEEMQVDLQLPSEVVERLKASLSYRYAHMAATKTPSKQTATQLKGRLKDQEAAEDTMEVVKQQRSWRKPRFLQEEHSGRIYGNALHTVMQYVHFDACNDLAGVMGEIGRLVREHYISEEQAAMLNAQQIANFFMTDFGEKLRTSKNVLREFKFSVLEDAARYCPDVEREQILLQGVVDCAIIDDDGIVIVDFKSDRVSTDAIDTAVEKYRPQIVAYANAMEKIYRLPVKSAKLYFFHLNQFVSIV